VVFGVFFLLFDPISSLGMDGEHPEAPPLEMEMDMLQRLTPQQLTAQLVEAVRSAPLETLTDIVCTTIKPEHHPPAEFLRRISKSQRLDVLRGCILVHTLSHGTKVPREFQLEAILGPLDGRDTVVSSATGSGKTMIMILLLLLRPMEHAILIVPLKRLQQAQVCYR
jgi:ATP-dependent helicase YprA (DUF1998 family)